MQTPGDNKGINIMSQIMKAIRIKFVAGKFCGKGNFQQMQKGYLTDKRRTTTLSVYATSDGGYIGRQNEVISAYITLLCMSNNKLRCAEF